MKWSRSLFLWIIPKNAAFCNALSEENGSQKEALGNAECFLVETVYSLLITFFCQETFPHLGQRINLVLLTCMAKNTFAYLGTYL